MLSKCWIKDSTGHLKPYLNAIHHYRGAQLIVVTQYHASVVLGFDATFTTLTDHTKITTHTMYLNKKIFLLPLIIIFRSYEQKVLSFFFFFECDCRRYENWGFFFPLHKKTPFLKPIQILSRLYDAYFQFKYQMWSHLQSWNSRIQTRGRKVKKGLTSSQACLLTDRFSKTHCASC